MRKLFWLFFLLCHQNGLAQLFGPNPPSLKWLQINTDTVRVIFPPQLDSQAARIASLIHQMAKQYPFVSDSLRSQKQFNKINIILQHQTTVPNAYVGLGPYRSEFFMTPPVTNHLLGSLPWPDILAIHEYRHVQQMNGFQNGISRIVRYLFGQQAYDLVMNAAVPNWFFEGDAVFMETVLSPQGRGRIPLFTRAYAALWQSGKKYSWMKMRNGSLKDYIPDFYQLGYAMVKYGYLKYGSGFWENVTRDASSFKGIFYPMQKAIKKHSGETYRNFRENALLQTRPMELKSFPAINYEFRVNRKYVNDYYFPHIAGEDSLVYLKETYRHRPAFYLKHGDKIKKIRFRDINFSDEQFSYRNGQIVYAAFENHPRWGRTEYSVLRLIDLAEGKQRTLKTKTRYFTPDISDDGSVVAAVQVNELGRSALHLLRADNGERLKEFSFPEIMMFTFPRFTNDGKILSPVRLRDGKMSVAELDTATGHLRLLLPASYFVIGNAVADSDYVYFNAAYTGNDEIYALRRADNKILRLTRSATGNYFLHAARGQLAWSSFTAEGFQTVRLTTEQRRQLLSEAEEVTEQYITISNDIDTIQNGIYHSTSFLKKAINQNFNTSPYAKSYRLINVHTWRPYFSESEVSFAFLSDNVLNTFQSQLYYTYDFNEISHTIGWSGIYGGFFPWISAGSEFSLNRSEVIGSRFRIWNQWDKRVGVIIPLQYIKGQTYRNFSLSSAYVHRNEFNRGFFKDSLGNTHFGYLVHAFSLSRFVRPAVQHIYPRAGFVLSVQHRHVIQEKKGYQFFTAGSLLLPGIAANHSLVFTGAFQERDTMRQVVFSNRFAYSRGYTSRYFSRMWRLSANYHFPLWHPDVGFGNLIYLYRLRANAFYDYTKVYSNNKAVTRNQRSAGNEIYFDLKIWNQVNISFGFQISFQLDRDLVSRRKGSSFALIVPVRLL
ncbi:MAG: hypothetical protein N2747_03340 [Chitinophagaceae bacterium]|nr:hypothetical protein [Chitinophagaceae bacterium]